MVVRKSEIRQDLIDQLERNGTFGSYYLDLIESYMALWEIKRKLVQDIRARGVIVTWDNGGGQSGQKRNESVGELNKICAQMLKLLSDLGLKPGKPKANSDSDNGDEEM
jgi:P27 family predicted phage terminase small subunit